MSEILTVREGVKKLVESAYNEISSIEDVSQQNAMFVLIDDYLKKNPIEYDNGIVRHLSLWSGSLKSKDKTLGKLYQELSMEIMPKINLSKSGVTYLSLMNQMYDVIKKVGPASIETVWIESGEEDDQFYKNKDSLHFLYDTAGTIGFVNIAESERGKNDFRYPEFNGYASPTLSFKILDSAPPHKVEGPAIKYHFDVLNKSYERFQKLAQD